MRMLDRDAVSIKTSASGTRRRAWRTETWSTTVRRCESMIW